MSYIIKYVAQVCDKTSGKVLKEKVLYNKDAVFPKTIEQFGLRHKEQIELIKNSQDFLLELQCNLMANKNKCPKCSKNLIKQGLFKSDFHDVFTDHVVHIQRQTCSCGWRNKFSIGKLYGSSSHPELLQLQAETGAKNSYEKASTILNNTCCTERTINNSVTLLKKVNKVGELLGQLKQTDAWSYSRSTTKTLVVNIDGGHIQDRDKNKHSFEEIITTVYKPEDVVQKPSGRKEIAKKICVASAMKDSQETIKKLTKSACIKLGMTQETEITALTDGANNCWSVVTSLKDACKSITKVLDWFHIGKNFKSREHKIPVELREIYDKAKWHLWHGRPKTAIIRLEQIKSQVQVDKSTIEKLDEIINYINKNQSNIVNYHYRKIKNLPFTSQLAETSVNCVINERQKNQKMQWTRKGAHNVLQIRTSLFSNYWDEDWKYVKQQIYKQAA